MYDVRCIVGTNVRSAGLMPFVAYTRTPRTPVHPYTQNFICSIRDIAVTFRPTTRRNNQILDTMLYRIQLLLLVLFLVNALNVQAQEDQQLTRRGVEEAYAPAVRANLSAQSRGMSQGTREALVLDLTGADAKMVTKLWEDYTKEKFDSKTKYDRKSKEYLSEAADVSGVNKGSGVNLYANVEERGSNSALVVWVDLGGGEFLNTYDHPERFYEAEEALRDFAVYVEKAKVEEELKAEEKNLDGLQRDLRQLESAKERAEREIERAKETIRKAEAEIEQNKKDQESKTKEIEGQRENVERVRRKLDRVGKQ